MSRLIVTIVAWTPAALAWWSACCWAFFLSMSYAENDRGWHLPEGITVAYNLVAIPVAVIIPPTIALLGMRRKLPGTRPRPGGFPVKPLRPPSTPPARPDLP